jgi:hypothetical protein
LQQVPPDAPQVLRLWDDGLVPRDVEARIAEHRPPRVTDGAEAE